MKSRIITIVCILFSCVFASFAQDDSTKVKKAKAERPDEGQELVLGGRVGVSLAKMRYNNIAYSLYERESVTRLVGGIFADYRFFRGLSVHPEFLVVGRGVNMLFDPMDIDYTMKSTYFDFRAPLHYTFLRDKKVRPFVGFGPSFNFVLGGNVKYSERKGSYIATYNIDKLTKSSLEPFDFGVYFGTGFKVAVPISHNTKNLYIGLEIGYDVGLKNNFTDKEIDCKAEALNLAGYSIIGTRRNGNAEFSLSVAYPLYNSKPVEKEEEEETIPEIVPQDTVAAVVEDTTPAIDTTVAEITADTLKDIVAADTVKEEVAVKDTTPKIVEKVEPQPKRCYSLEEVLEFIDKGESLADKKVCAFGDVKFALGTANLSNHSQRYLDKLVKVMKKLPNLTLVINGYTDNNGSRDFNLMLSKQRAESVANYFIKNGIEPSRLKCNGYGPDRPLDSSRTKDGDAKNRRVEFELLDK